MNTRAILAGMLACAAVTTTQVDATNLNSGNYDYVISVYACDSDDLLIQLKSAGWVDVKPSVVGTIAADWMMQLVLTGKQTGYFAVNWSAGLIACGYATAPITTFSATANP